MVSISIADERERLARSYKAFIIRGILAIAFAFLIFLMPGMALLTFVFMFGMYAIADGISNIVEAIRRTRGEPWWLLLIHGIVSFAAGLITFFVPGLTALSLLYVIAAWAVVTGILQVVNAIRLRKHISGEWLLGISGALSVVFGVLVVMYPGAGALAMSIWIGAYALAMGVLSIAVGFRLRKVARADRDAGHFTTPAPSH